MTPSATESTNYVFVYGSLRPDDDSGMPWTQTALKGMQCQKAYLQGAKLYKDTYASVVLGFSEEFRVIGWVVTTPDSARFSEKLCLFDQIEGCNPESGGGLYQRAVVDVRLNLSDPRFCVNGPIGSEGQCIRAYVYHRPDCDRGEWIESGDWLERVR